MKKLRFLLLDANVVIELFEFGLWQTLLERCEVLLARTVAEREAQFFVDQQDQRCEIDLAADIAAERVSIVDVAAADLKRFFDRFDPLYLERLDPGEAESLAYLVRSSEPCQICSSDAIVFRVLAQLSLLERGLSLEEVLQQVGLGRKLAYQFSKKFRESWTKRGQQESVQRIGLRSDNHC
jgi:hypothetical protein